MVTRVHATEHSPLKRPQLSVHPEASPTPHPLGITPDRNLSTQPITNPNMDHPINFVIHNFA